MHSQQRRQVLAVSEFDANVDYVGNFPVPSDLLFTSAGDLLLPAQRKQIPFVHKWRDDVVRDILFSAQYHLHSDGVHPQKHRRRLQYFLGTQVGLNRVSNGVHSLCLCNSVFGQQFVRGARLLPILIIGNVTMFSLLNGLGANHKVI